MPVGQRIKDIKKFKTNTSGKVSFKPEVVASFFDEEHSTSDFVDYSASVANTVRYSDADLEFFKEIVLARLDREKAELRYLRQSANIEENTDEKQQNNFYSHDDQNTMKERNYYIELISRKLKLITHLEDALVRIQNKTYGVCRVTGKLIDKERLKLVPHATLSKEAKDSMANK